MARIYPICYYCHSNFHFLHKCPKLIYIHEKSPNIPETAVDKYIRKRTEKYPTLSRLKLLNQHPMDIYHQKNIIRKHSFIHKGTYMSSLRGTKTQREPGSYERIPSYFSSIKKNITCPPISSSSCTNEILIINCMNSPLGLKKMHKINSEEKVFSMKKLKSLQSHSSTKNQGYNDFNESNRVYYDKKENNVDSNEVIFETVNSQLSRLSEKDKPPQFRSETNRTSNIIEEYSDLLSKKSKFQKNTNRSANSQGCSSFTNFDQNMPFTTSSKCIQSKENRSSKMRQNYERKNISSNSIMTQTQAVIQNYIEKLSKTVNKIGDPPEKKYKPHKEFEKMISYKIYFKENNFENVIRKLKN